LVEHFHWMKCLPGSSARDPVERCRVEILTGDLIEGIPAAVYATLKILVCCRVTLEEQENNTKLLLYYRATARIIS
ncbi:MAG: hypothetical protein II449_00325, partial [Prevotella sp.]|nr:hypothetical protein [Prevotella sp.]